ncbi:unnamed protein product [Taenia asiatica]|uniref:ApaG domain-containing protein n=1 Tax=Taenia asiatica TaxID=60517 RepID=A0A0R3W170_TAEAS|nr:unnamed protein product [Taenia asiatica]
MVAVAPIGQLQPTQQSPYEPGQLILHRLFGYRGVVLYSWKASLFKMKKITLEVDPPDNPSEEIVPPFKTPVKCEQPIYVYAVLFDFRDVALSSLSMITGVPFLPHGEGPCKATYNVTDMDYAFHEDLLPYTCTHELPLLNSSFMELMHFDPEVEPKVYPTDRLEQMLKKFGARLEVQSVHQETTDGVRVTAVPFLMGRRKLPTKAVVHYVSFYAFSTVRFLAQVAARGKLPLSFRHSFYHPSSPFILQWRYLILIENMTHRGMKLCGVYWNFSTADGRPLNVYDAEFVETPLLPVRSPCFQYHGCFQVPTPNVRARGFFKLEDVDGFRVIADIPLLPFRDVEYYRELYLSDTGPDDGSK